MWRELDNNGQMNDRKICPIMSDSRGCVLCQGLNCYAAYPQILMSETVWFCTIIDGPGPAQKSIGGASRNYRGNMSNEVLTAARILIAPGQVVEVRAITDDGIASGYFDSAEVLAAKVEALDGLPSVQGVYITLNAVNPALLSRRANRIKMRLGKKDVTTADNDIVKRQWFPVDIDPVRPSGVSSTEQEHLVAITKPGG